MRRIAVVGTSLAMLLLPAASAGAHSVTCSEASLEAARTASDFVEFLEEDLAPGQNGYAYELGRCTSPKKVRGHRHEVVYKLTVEKLRSASTPYTKVIYTIRVGYRTARARSIDGTVYRADGKRARQPD